MKIEGNNRVISLIVVVMSLIVISGSFCTAGMMKALGYPEGEWNALSVFVRSYGFVFLFVPFFWGLLALISKREKYEEGSFFTGVVVVGIIVFLGLTFLFVNTTFKCKKGRWHHVENVD